MIVPGSHQRSLEVSDRAESVGGRKPIASNTATVADIEDGDGIEICGNDGDLIVFNPLCYHSASPNKTKKPRYVYFTSFYHPAAARLKELIRKTNYRDHFPESLRAGLTPELRVLLDE